MEKGRRRNATMDEDRRGGINRARREDHYSENEDYFDDYDEEMDQNISSRYNEENAEEQMIGYEYDDEDVDEREDFDRGGTGRRGFGGRMSHHHDEIRQRGFGAASREEARRKSRSGNDASRNANRPRRDEGDNSRRGFASMPREEVRRIARMGGEASHSGERGPGRLGRSDDERSSSRRGFAAMPREEVRSIARKDGEASGGGRRRPGR